MAGTRRQITYDTHRRDRGAAWTWRVDLRIDAVCDVDNPASARVLGGTVFIRTTDRREVRRRGSVPLQPAKQG